MCPFVYVFFFEQKTAYEMRISDWSSDVCSSDLFELLDLDARRAQIVRELAPIGTQPLNFSLRALKITDRGRAREAVERPCAERQRTGHARDQHRLQPRPMPVNDNLEIGSAHV